jgi:hypothetical protein
MLKDLTVDQARFVALLAKAARAQRDAFLGNVAEDDLAKELKPARGEHNPTAALGFEPLPPSALQTAALRGRSPHYPRWHGPSCIRWYASVRAISRQRNGIAACPKRIYSATKR